LAVIIKLLKMEAKRRAILDLVHAGKSTMEISRALNVHRNTVNNVRKLFSETQDVKKRSGGSRKSVRTKRVIQNVRRRVKTNPWRSMRGIAKQMGVSNTTMQRIVKKDLCATSRAITTKQLVTQDSREKRNVRARLLLNDVKHSSGRVTIFSDEKLFCVYRVLIAEMVVTLAQKRWRMSRTTSNTCASQSIQQRSWCWVWWLQMAKSVPSSSCLKLKRSIQRSISTH